MTSMRLAAVTIFDSLTANSYNSNVLPRRTLTLPGLTRPCILEPRPVVRRRCRRRAAADGQGELLRFLAAQDFHEVLAVLALDAARHHQAPLEGFLLVGQVEEQGAVVGDLEPCPALRVDGAKDLDVDARCQLLLRWPRQLHASHPQGGAFVLLEDSPPPEHEGQDGDEHHGRRSGRDQRRTTEHHAELPRRDAGSREGPHGRPDQQAEQADGSRRAQRHGGWPTRIGGFDGHAGPPRWTICQANQQKPTITRITVMHSSGKICTRQSGLPVCVSSQSCQSLVRMAFQNSSGLETTMRTQVSRRSALRRRIVSFSAASLSNLAFQSA